MKIIEGMDCVDAGAGRKKAEVKKLRLGLEYAISGFAANDDAPVLMVVLIHLHRAFAPYC